MVSKPMLMMAMHGSHIVVLRLVTTFEFFAIKNAQISFVRAEGYLKPYAPIDFDGILLHQNCRSKLSLSDLSSP